MAPARREVTFDVASSIASPLAWPHPDEGPATVDGLVALSAARALVGGVGYTNLRDRSFGPLLIEQLQRRAWPPGVVVEDLSYGPIDVLFKLQAEAAPFRLGVFVGAVARGREPGCIERLRIKHEEQAGSAQHRALGILDLVGEGLCRASLGHAALPGLREVDDAGLARARIGNSAHPRPPCDSSSVRGRS